MVINPTAVQRSFDLNQFVFISRFKEDEMTRPIWMLDLFRDLLRRVGRLDDLVKGW
jgi:hypothetical protein